MPNQFGGDQCDKDYAPHMWLGNHFIGNSEKIVQINEWWYRAGRLDNETIVAERWKEYELFRVKRQINHEVLALDQIPTELLKEIESVSRSEQEDARKLIEKQFGYFR